MNSTRWLAPLLSEGRAELQTIEVKQTVQMPGIFIVGLPAREVTEAKERVRAAIESCNFELPRRRVVLNLSPASVKKEGTGTDLGMALALMGEKKLSELPVETRDDSHEESYLAWGELSLDGSVQSGRFTSRTLCVVEKFRPHHVFLSHQDEATARQIIPYLFSENGFSESTNKLPIPKFYFVKNLREAFQITLRLKSRTPLATLQSPTHSSFETTPVESKPATTIGSPHLLPLNPQALRVLKAIWVGGHHALLVGPKGCGKSRLLEWISKIPFAPSKVTYLDRLSVCESVSFQRPVRSVNSDIRPSSLLGTIRSSTLRTGEFTQSHGGFLIADEFGEWHRDSREALRGPLESRKVLLSRSQDTIVLPAAFQFVGASNLCPCGGYPKQCSCTPRLQQTYLAKLFGPVLDRIEILHMIGDFQSTGPLVPTDVRFLRQLIQEIERLQTRARFLWGNLPAEIPAASLESWIQDRPQIAAQLNAWPEINARSRHQLVRLAMTYALIDDPSYHSSSTSFDDSVLDSKLKEAYWKRPERLLKGLHDSWTNSQTSSAAHSI